MIDRLEDAMEWGEKCMKGR